MYTTPINQAVMMGTKTGTDQTKQAAASGDFAAMLMQMFGGQQSDVMSMDGLLGGDSAMQYAQQLLAQQGETDELVQQDGTQNAMQMLAALFAGTPADVNFEQSPMAYQQGGTQDAVAAAAIQRTALAMQQGSPASGEEMTSEQLEGLTQTKITEPLTNRITPSQTVITPTEQPEKNAKSNTVILGTRTVDESQVKREVDPLMSAYNRIYNIHKPAETAGKTIEPVDVEAMQQAVDNGTYLNPSVASLRDTAAASEQVTPRDIANQVQTGIITNLDKDQKEFVIKLRPEGLGNITVKMVENDGKISLSIITSTQQAQNALSSEISSLREALRPFNAEVTQLIANDMSFAQQQGMNEQRHDGNQGEQHRNAARFWEPEDTTTPEELREYAQHLSSALSARI